MGDSTEKMDAYIFCGYYDEYVETLAFEILVRGGAKDEPKDWDRDYKLYMMYSKKLIEARMGQNIAELSACRAIMYRGLRNMASQYAKDVQLNLTPELELEMWEKFTADHGTPSVEDQGRLWAIVDLRNTNRSISDGSFYS